MLFFSNFFNFNSQNIKKLEKQAKDILELPKDFKAFRLDKEVVIIDNIKGKIVQRIKDTLPLNPARAALELIKRLKLSEQTRPDSFKKSDVWTCGFRDNEARWVWYMNGQPKMTVGYNDAFKTTNLEDKVFFFSARYGTSIINQIKEQGLEKISKQINGLVFEHPFVKVKCCHCSNEENYTIDDLVDATKTAKYDSEFIVCQNCNELVKLV
jgi:hypothetical protein